MHVFFLRQVTAIEELTGEVSETSVTVTILDSNDNPPSFTREVYTGIVVENSPVGTKVNMTDSLYASDADSNTNVTYSIRPIDTNRYMRQFFKLWWTDDQLAEAF